MHSSKLAWGFECKADDINIAYVYSTLLLETGACIITGNGLKVYSLCGQRDSAAGKTLVLHTIDLNSLPSIPYVSPKHNQE